MWIYKQIETRERDRRVNVERAVELYTVFVILLSCNVKLGCLKDKFSFFLSSYKLYI